MPNISGLNARVAVSSDLQLDAASKEIDTLMDHKIWNDKSNTILQHILQSKSTNKDHYIDL